MVNVNYDARTTSLKKLTAGVTFRTGVWFAAHRNSVCAY